jgi:hypothetical protein
MCVSTPDYLIGRRPMPEAHKTMHSKEGWQLVKIGYSNTSKVSNLHTYVIDDLFF